MRLIVISLAGLCWIGACGAETEDTADDAQDTSTEADQDDSESNASDSAAEAEGTKGDVTPAEADEANASADDATPGTDDDEVQVPIERASEFDAGSDPERNNVTAAELCARIAEINCAGEAYCCENPRRTVEDCRADLLKTCASDLMLDRVAMQERAQFDAEAAAGAYAELERRASECDPTVAQWGAAPDGLRGLLRGSVAEGQSCKPVETVPDPVTLAAALLSCENPETHACVYESPLGEWTCQPRSAESGGCVTDNNCDDGLYCVIAAPGLPGECAQRKEIGQACDGPTQCASLFCKGGTCVEADQQAAYCLLN